MTTTALLSHRFVRFVLASGAAAAANFGSRIAFSQFVDFPVAVVLAFFVGLSTAFLLNRRYVFPAATRSVREQMLWFVAINLFAVVQTLAISLFLLHVFLPWIGVHWHAEEIAHGIGVVAPAIVSYAGHKRLSFR